MTTDRLTVWQRILDVGIVPLFSSSDAGLALDVVATVHASGATVVEFTHRAEGALSVFERLAAERGGMPDLLLGAGSVQDPYLAARYLDLGADFLVSPFFVPEIARWANGRHAAYVPGAGSMREISTAEEAGAEIVKVFPAAALGGPGFIRAVLGPRPWSRLMPTGGVKAESTDIKAWFEAGAAALGLGSDLISPRLRGSDVPDLGRRVADVVRWAAEAKAGE
jgi:2-dehydro-3-deoxyphosphogluconate aldolase/(4S)-4-hydroxy-2-oxoglutarate aldolase